MTFHWPSKNFFYRSLFGGLFTALAAIFITLSQYQEGRWFFVAGMVVIHLVALAEFVRLCKAKGFAPAAQLLYWISALVLIMHAIVITHPEFRALPSLLLFFGAIGTPYVSRQSDSIVNLALTALGILYITLPFRWLLDISFLPGTAFWITWLLVTTKGSDMIAYFSGKVFGKHPLAPLLSPKKTLEGALFGILGSAVLSLLLALVWINGPSLPLSTWALLGTAIGATAMGGDLFESLLKRDAGVKDSNAIPGLGGVLDIIDSLLFTTPLLYIYLSSANLI